MVLKIIGLIIVTIGVIAIYDARTLTRSWFSFGEQNEATAGFKIIGFIIALIGAFIVYFSR